MSSNSPPAPHVLVLGDLMLDRYLWGRTDRISPEAPVPVVDVGDEGWALGGAGNVVANLAALGAQVHLVAVGCSQTPEHRRVQELLTNQGVTEAHLVDDPDRPITVKTRVMAAHHQLMRFDVESKEPVSATVQAELLAAIDAALPHCQAVVLSDYGKGVLTTPLCGHAIAHAQTLGVPVVVDPKGRDYRKYGGATVVTPNRKEAAEAVGYALGSSDALSRAGEHLCREFALQACLITLSEEGMALCRGPQMERIPTRAREVFDVTGAGDTVVAALAYGLGSGRPLNEACTFANLAAGVVVGKLGAATATLAEISAFADGSHSQRAQTKIGPLSALQPRVAALRNRGQRIVFTNGCFDILHAGHTRYLEQAKELGDKLVVGVNSDASVTRLKGPERPVTPAEDRLQVLAALGAVDFVVLFEEDTPERLITALRPDVLVKGGDYTEETIVGAPFVRSYGGRVETIPLYPGRSTTGTLARINKERTR